MDSLSAIERLSFDLLVEADLHGMDNELAALDEEELAEYLKEQARRLAPHVEKVIEGFRADGLQSVREWTANHAG